jgi:hypothetical protein
MTDINEKALAKLRELFPPEQIGKLPKGGVSLDFIGHGYITNRFLDADPEWNWRPMAFDEHGLPLFDEFGGLWMYLTVGGVERIGYGDSGGKKGPNAIKEAIGDALRNSGMRFGAGLELWCKGDPDAPAAPKPKTPADIARDKLAVLVKRNKLDGRKIGQRFESDFGLSIYEGDEQTIESFTQIIADEVAIDKAVADG